MKCEITIIDVLREACAKYADKPAFSALNHTLSYAELDRFSASFAGYLQQELKLQPGDRVAVQLPNLLQYPVVAFGILRAGCVLVNTNPLYTARELKHQLYDSGAKAIVVLENIASTLSQIVTDTQVEHVITTQIGDMHRPLKRLVLNLVVKHIRRMVPPFCLTGSTSLPRALSLGANKYQPVPVAPGSLAVLQYTGGTTGVAKGAMLSHSNLTANMQQICEHMRQLFGEVKETYAAPLPLYHIYAFTIHALCILSTGNHSILIPNPRDLRTVVKVFKDYPLTGFVGINTLYNALLDDSEFKQLDFSRLRSCSAGGMALTSDTARRWEKLTGCRIREGYGLTESSPVVAANPDNGVRLGTIGTLLPCTEARIVTEAGEEARLDEAGELWVRGPQVMTGYWQCPEETANVMSEDGWLKTGDIATRDEDGYLKIVDRKKDMISVSGFKVFPNEIEEVACMHPDIVECAAIGVPDSKTGEAVKLLVVSRDPGLNQDMIRKFCRSRLTAYKVPRLVVFRSELPKSNVGKILRRELRDQESGDQRHQKAARE